MAFTYFFRDLHTLEVIRDHALPYLRTKQYINIWDAGCAMGQEPYSLAMILSENLGYMYFRNVKILASDIDESNLFARIIAEGTYPEELVRRIPEDLFHKYFSPDSEKHGHFKLHDEIRKSVYYQKHDLLSLIPPKRNFGLVLCKNVLLHFNESQRTDVIKMYYDSLIDGGFLAVEQTQKIPLEVQHLFQPVVTNAQVFKKI
jgi:chemotaxis protein methyltransferase CheR